MSLDMSKYLGLFVQEATEHLEALGRDVVRLEREGVVAEIVDSMFRHAHSVKGMAASMGFSPIAALSHRLEDLVERLRRHPDVLSPEVVDVILESADTLLGQVQTASRGEPLASAPALLERISALLGRHDARSAELAASASSSAAGTAKPAAAPAEQPGPAAVPPESDGAASPAGDGLLVQVQIAEGCPTPGVRAFLVHKKLGPLGTITKAEPTLEDCKAGRIPGGRLRLVLVGAATAEAVQKALSSVADLARVEVAPAPVAPPAVAREGLKAPVAEAGAARVLLEGKGPSTIRVSTDLLDTFLDSVGELILATSRLRELGKNLPERHRREVDEGVDALHRIVKDLHGRVMTVRMTPLALLTDRLPRIARDLARQLGREIAVEVEGAEIELDRAILEELGDPLIHLVRNSLDHGLEPPEDRKAMGKPARGRIALRARRDRDRVVLELEDDGRGMDPARLRAAAVERGALAPEAAKALSDREALLLACLPGVSTAHAISDLSGRGVGMDAVKRTVEGLGGTLEIDSTLGKGTRFTLRLPLTVAVVQLLLVGVGDELFGLPIAKVLGAVEARPESLDKSVDAPLLPWGAELVPVHRLASLLALPGAVSSGPRPHVIVESDAGRVALEVERLLGQEEVVLKPLPALLDLVPGLAGVTILGSGRPVFILDVPRLLAA